jgi:hypothetical protein
MQALEPQALARPREGSTLAVEAIPR